MSYVGRITLTLFLIWLARPAECLQKTQLALMSEAQLHPEQCTVVLFNLGKQDTDEIASRATRPIILIQGEVDAIMKVKYRELFSASVSACVSIYSKASHFNLELLEFLLANSRYRSIYVLSDAKVPRRLDTYLKEDLVYIKILGDGKLLMTNYCLIQSTQVYATMPWNNIRFKTCSTTLRGKDMKVAAFVISPYVTHMTNHYYAGAEVDLLNMISRQLHFDYVIKVYNSPVTKNKATGEFEGVIGSVINGSCQFGIGGMAITTFPVAFLPITADIDIILLSPKPKPIKPLANFLSPFTLIVWLGFLGALIICSAFCLAFICLETKTYNWTIFLDLFGTFCGQNIKKTLVSPMIKTIFVIVGFWTVAITVAHAAYCCNLRADMIRKMYEKTAETDEDLMQMGKDLYMPQRTGLVYDYENSQSAAKQELFQRAKVRDTIYTYDKKQVMIKSYEERMIKNGGSRLVFKSRANDVLMDYETRLGYQPLQASKKVVMSYHGVISMPLCQPWSEEFDRAISRVVAGGIVEHLMEKYSVANKYSFGLNNIQDDESQLEPYSPDHVLGVLIVLFSGLFLATVMFALEVLHNKTATLINGVISIPSMH